MKHYETTGYGSISVNFYPKGWFGTVANAEEQGIYTSFKKAKAREIRDLKDEINRNKEYLKDIKKLTIQDCG